MDNYREHQNEDAGEHNNVHALPAGHDAELEALMQEVHRLQAATTRIQETLAALSSWLDTITTRNSGRHAYAMDALSATGPSRNGTSTAPERGTLARPAATSSANLPNMPRIAMTVPSAERDEYYRARQERLPEQAVQAILDAMRTFHIDSDPRLSGTSTTIPLRKQRLTQEDPITLMSIAKPAEAICGHIFEAESLVQAWTHERTVAVGGRCPLCRRALMTSGDMHLLDMGERKVEKEVRGEIKRDGEDDSSDSDQSQKAIGGKAMED